MADDRVAMTVRFTQKEYEAITRLSNEWEMPMSQVVRQAVRQLANLDQPQKESARG